MLIGKRYGRLTIIEDLGKVNNYRRVKCRCDCGNEKTVRKSNLDNGHIRSCGCLRKEASRQRETTHGFSRTRIYNIWCSMIQRCYDPNHKYYKNYGGRGITVCDEWRNNSSSFIEWAFGNGYKNNLSLDRIDNNGNYGPSNCRWATKLEQANNARSNHILTVDGITDTMANLCRLYGVNYDMVERRINKGHWDADSAFKVLPRARRRSAC